METVRRRLQLGDACIVVDATVKNKPVKKSKQKARLRPYHLTAGAEVPGHLCSSVKNYHKIADNIGISRDRITNEIAEYLLKGYYEMAKKRAA